jgi:LysM repeat protein
LGQQLRIRPDGDQGSQSPKTGSKPQQQPKTYTVKSGETLFGIAQSHDVTVKALKKANELDNNRIQKGQELIIP